MAVDCMPFRTFLEAHKLLGSDVEYKILDVTELSPNSLGLFDIVLFFGVLYHLRHPLQGLETVLTLTKDLALVDSFVSPDEPRRRAPVLEFYDATQLGGQLDNWYGPTTDCLLALCRSAGFAQVRLEAAANQQASVTCKRRWPAPPEHPTVERPWLMTATNNRNFECYFHPAKDEYLCCFFLTSASDLRPEDVLVEVDGFGTPSLVVVNNGKASWQVNCLRPPGLTKGRHSVRLRIRDSDYSDPVDIFVVGDAETSWPPDMPRESPSTVQFLSVEYDNGCDLRYSEPGFLRCYFKVNCDRISAEDIDVFVSDSRCHVRNVMRFPDHWQAQVSVPASILPGTYSISLCVRGSVVAPIVITLP